MQKPRISAMTFDGTDWSGWSNSGKQKNLHSLEDAVAKIQNDPEIGWRIIDADNLKIWVSDMAFSERAVMSARVNFGVEISDIYIGFPQL